ncbi:hypothetical protein AVEN_190732-1 [Araneus ventricosus]|uniref:Uncharacterized protein n=1 Tax=Araneus ventricosus TaxID=182803 RepID=A0A4Y2MQ93_ARAVE|nr:hypothetical protein AVEN_190732-1 [Araneus ventricosus]
MRIGVNRGKVWKSNIVRFPFGALGHKSEIRSCGGEDALSKKRKPTVGEGCMGSSQTEEIRAGRGDFESERGRRRCSKLGDRTTEGDGFGVSAVRPVNDPPKWIGLKFQPSLVNPSKWCGTALP